MYKLCDKCKKEYDKSEKKCSICGKKLEVKYTEEELKEIEKQNDDITVINTTLINTMLM